jgi:hypothetical protein
MNGIFYRTWDMSDQEIELWERVFAGAVSRAAMSAIAPTAFVETFMQEMTEEDNVNVYVPDIPYSPAA